MKKIALVGMLLSLAMNSYAQTASVHEDKAWQSRFDQLFHDTKKPDWLRQPTQDQPVKISYAGKEYEVLFMCKPHDCSNQEVAVIYNENMIVGLWSQTKDNSNEQNLTWLTSSADSNAGDIDIDVKTILYSVISGSLSNHSDGRLWQSAN